MKDQIEAYASSDAVIVDTTPVGVIVRSSQRPRADVAIRFDLGGNEHWGRVIRSLGNERFEVQVLNPPESFEQASVAEILDAPASLPFPWDVGPVAASDLSLRGPGDGPQWPPAAVAMMDLSGTRSALQSGFEAIDLLAPIVGGGFNLVIDAHRDRTAFDRLVESVVDTVDIDVRVADEESGLEIRRRIHAGSAVDQYETAMAAALAWVAHERHNRSSIVAVLELPVVVAEWGAQRPSSLGPSSRIADAVASTRSCDVTCIVRLPAATGPDGFADIVETLALGDVDSQLFIDSRGRFDPARSHSSAPVDDAVQRRRSQAQSVLHQATRAADRLNLWGEDELSEPESLALKRAEALNVSLIDG